MPTWKGALPTLVAAAGDVASRGGDYVGPTGWGEVWGLPGAAHPSRRARDAKMAGRLAEACQQLTGVALDPGGGAARLAPVRRARVASAQAGEECCQATSSPRGAPTTYRLMSSCAASWATTPRRSRSSG